ncbi:hypothetical protein F5884DRAFT_816620 [Xylogone sp. PMI_703]|nr:hypothetical protein F5884DRAFT_816620 [Xylogone sp. PMI_703]
MADGLNPQRTARVADLLADFQNLQFYIASAPNTPPDQDDYYTDGWTTLRQCYYDGQHILNCAEDIQVPAVRGGAEEQKKAELEQVLLDAYARRHEAQKIYLRQVVAQQWIGWRDNVLQGQRPHAGVMDRLNAYDEALRAELAAINDDTVYAQMRTSDYQAGRWTLEDPTLRQVQRWLRNRQP